MAKSFALCSVCSRRQGDGAAFVHVEPRACFVCRGLSQRVVSIELLVLRRIRRYQFQTFAVGAIIPEDVQEREDQLRSDLQIRGRETIKYEMARTVAAFLEKKTRKKVDRRRPELTVVVDFGREEIMTNSKSLFVSARYTKPRGVLQKREFCETCSGRGCPECKDGYAKVPSVEELVNRRFVRLLRCSKTKITWLGSEDKESIVYPPGRPFVIEAKDPQLRRVPSRMTMATGMGRSVISSARALPGRPTTTPSFVFQTRVFIDSAGQPLDRIDMSNARRLLKTTIRYRNTKGRIVEKRVHRLKIEERNGKELVASISMDGGLPVKRLVSGESVSPSLSEALGVALICRRFDILRVKASGSVSMGNRGPHRR